MTTFQIVHSDAEQPYYARVIASNGEEVWRTSENYADLRDAERAIALLGEAYAPAQVEVHHVDLRVSP